MSVLLTACVGGGEALVSFQSGVMKYDSGVFKTAIGDTALVAKGDESCWVDLSDGMTTPLPSEEGSLTVAKEEGISILSNADGVPQYIKFRAAGYDVYARVSVENPDNCTGKLIALAAQNQ